jgi:thymidylate kinase
LFKHSIVHSKFWKKCENKKKKAIKEQNKRFIVLFDRFVETTVSWEEEIRTKE